MSQSSNDGLGDLTTSNHNQEEGLTEEQKARLEIVNRQIDEKNIRSQHDGRHETYLILNR